MHMPGRGTRRTVYTSVSQDAQIETLGVSMAEVIRVGLNTLAALAQEGSIGGTPDSKPCDGGSPGQVRARRARPQLPVADVPGQTGCPHPRGRRQKAGTYCPACGTGGPKP